MWIKYWKIGIALTVVALIGGEQEVSGLVRKKRSPFKKHKIIIVNEGQEQYQQGGGEGWGAPPPPPVQQGGGDGWGAPPPPPVQQGWGAPPPPPVQQGWSAPPPPQKETIVEHHHHWEVAPRPPPQPPSHSHSVVIELNKGGHGGKFKEDAEHIKKFKGEIDSTIDEIERDKQEKLELIKKDAEAKLDALAQIPHMIASDIDFIGKKIVEDLERKKAKDEGVSIQIWKGKGKGGHSGGSASSEEAVHHHHYYHDEIQQRPPSPPPPQRQPPPPRKQYHYGEGDVLEGLSKFAEAGTHFMDYLGGGGQSQYRVPVTDGGSYESGERGGWSQGGQGKGFQVRVWKSKGFRRR